MKKQNIPDEILKLLTEEEINIFQEIQIKIKSKKIWCIIQLFI